MGSLCCFTENLIMNNYIPVNTPLLNGNERKYLLECIESGWISSEGPFISEFENKFAKLMGRKHGIAVCNGTAAIDATIEALGISTDDEVIMPTFTIISCIAQIVRNGGKPVLVDSDPITWNMDVNQIESKITKRTKAIMVVHIYGLPVDMNPVLKIANQHGIKVIEDAAEMHGQSYRGFPCGSFGDISTFSFYPNKHITTGEGGMILTDDDELAENCRSLRNLCFQKDKRFVHERLGWNLRMTNLQAALGLAQLERLNEFVNLKRRMGAIYTEILKRSTKLQLPKVKTEYANNIYWVYGVIIDQSSGFNAEKFMQKLHERGIGTRPFFFPMHQQPILRKMGFFENETYPISEFMYQHGFYLPSGLGLTEEQISYIANTTLEVLNS